MIHHLFTGAPALRADNSCSLSFSFCRMTESSVTMSDDSQRVAARGSFTDDSSQEAKLASCSFFQASELHASSCVSVTPRFA